MRWVAVLSPVLVVVWACGGDVVVDGRPGTGAGGGGGAGNANNASAGAVTPDTAVVNASAGPASVGPGVTTGPAGTCSSCVSGLRQGTCGAQVQNCYPVPTCFDLIECHLDCHLEQPCVQGCDMEYPEAVGATYDVLQCAVCEQCFESCPEEANTYCLLQ